MINVWTRQNYSIERDHKIETEHITLMTFLCTLKLCIYQVTFISRLNDKSKNLSFAIFLRCLLQCLGEINIYRYPSTLEAFYQARLPGTWEEERSGKRMKLPVPETWETQVSLKGNKASTWEDLIGGSL